MKKLLTLFLALLSALSLANLACADVIAPTPVEIAGSLFMDNIAAILVAAVVTVTGILLWRLRKKK